MYFLRLYGSSTAAAARMSVEVHHVEVPAITVTLAILRAARLVLELPLVVLDERVDLIHVDLDVPVALISVLGILVVVRVRAR